MPILIEELPDEDVYAPIDEDADAQSFIDGDDVEEVGQVTLDEDASQFMERIILTCIVFLGEFCNKKLFPYQTEEAYRIIESVLIGDGETITIEQARQSGKSEVLCDVIATLMVLLPRLAKAYPRLFGKFEEGFWVGCFAPTEEQADTVWGRIVDRLTSEKATSYLLDPEIDDSIGKGGSAKAKVVTLKKSGSFCRRQTCNPKAKIESKTYHFVLVDECQDADEYVVNKAIGPMLGFYNGTRVYTGTPARHKNVFYKSIQFNKRRANRRNARQNHFSYDYKFVCKYNQNYRKFIAKEKGRLGEDSDEFQLSYCCKWLLDQGMFVTEETLANLGDPGMTTYKSWWQSQVVVGIDPARTKDSTVVTVVWVDWDRPDAFGFYEHRILNWLEIHNQEWEKQYSQILNFLSNYNILRIGVDTTGMGSAVYDRIRVLFPGVEVVECPSDTKPQAARWKHLKSLIERQALIYPAASSVRRTRSYRRFIQQMSDLETKFQGPYMLAAAPDEAEAHDDYADSAAIACSMTLVDTLQEVEVFASPFVGRR